MHPSAHRRHLPDSGVRAGELGEASKRQAPTSPIKTIHHGTEPLSMSGGQEICAETLEPRSPANVLFCLIDGGNTRPKALTVKVRDWGGFADSINEPETPKPKNF